MSSPAPPFQSALLAGALAGMSVDLSLFPLDTLKTRLQSSAGFFPSGGFTGIYRGIGSALVGSAPGAAFFFCTYETTKGLLGAHDTDIDTDAPGNSSSSGSGGGTGTRRVLAHMAASSLGEVAACAVRVPTEVVKQRAQAGHHGGSSARALRAILARSATHGPAAAWRELYRGWGITVFREVPFTVIQFPLWEAMKAWGRQRRRRRQQLQQLQQPHGAQSHDDRRSRAAGDVPAAESALYGSLAGAVAAALTTPLDVLKTRVMLSRERVAVPDVLRGILRDEGVRPLFAGIAPRVMWISVGGAIFLGSYQWAINSMGGIRARGGRGGEDRDDDDDLRV